jgi:uncharacterized protein (DUF885 family)
MTTHVAQLAAHYWDCLMEAEPTWAHLLGDTGKASRYEDASRAHEDVRIAELRDFAAQADAIDEAGLGDDDRVTRAVLVNDASTRADMMAARFPELGADPIFGLQRSAALVCGMLNVPDAATAAAMVDKLAGMGQFFADLAERQREGVRNGRVSASFAVRGTIEQIDRALAVPLDEDPVVAAIKAPEGVDTPGWRQQLTEAVARHLRPGMAQFRDALRDDVLAVARPDDKAGLCWLPGGEDDYARTLRYYTTTGLGAQEIHDIGLAQLESLAEEYRALGSQALGLSDLEEIFTAMRTDPALHFETGQQLVDASKVALQRAWDAMGDRFEVLPQAPCAVEGTTTGAKAFYFPPANDGSRGGTFFINIEDPTAWGTFELESLAFHEGIPGHHLQLAVAAELPDAVPAIRKYTETAAYAEGWGLYTERLADEMALYSSDVDRLGMLSADSLRACRLVVDTGLHALGWSREQAVQFMVDNSPMTRGICQPEVDRYLVSPGQATSYMIGRLEIQRMRREAEERQGDAFDIKAFHSAVLDSGTLPLGVLDQVVRRRLGA